MKKKLLQFSVFAILVATVTSGLYLKDQKTYKARPEVKPEPYNMNWAKMDDRTGEYNALAAAEVKTRIMNRISRTGDLGLNFYMRGPDNVGGRTRAVIEVFGKPDTLISGGVSGGLFISYNGGATWQVHSQFANLDSSSSIISAIHQDTNNGRIYVGTGSSFEGSANSPGVGWPGFGIYVSTDNGETFSHLESTTPDDRFSTSGTWVATNRISTNSDGDIFAATERGLKVSRDLGETWEDVVYLNETLPNQNRCADVFVTASDRVLTGFYGGAIYLSDDGTARSFELINERGMQFGASRVVVSVAPSDEDYMYVMFNNNDACLDAVYKSTNGGESFTRILVPHDDFTPMSNGDYCQGVYDMAMICSANNPEQIFIGGITLWRYDGSLTRVATEGGSPPFQDIAENYVHADKHFFYNSPNSKGRMYVTSDGGVAVTENNGRTWQGLNKGYITTQFYGIAHFNGGSTVIGGTQDNGTLAILGNNPNDPQIAYQATGGDGIDCEASQVSGIVFTTSQNGATYRLDVSAGADGNSQPPFAAIGFDGGPFLTVVKLWESLDDETSKDSITFEVTDFEAAIATGNGALRTFNETVVPVQPAANVIETTMMVESSGQVLVADPSDPTNLIGDGFGSITYNTNNNQFDIDVTFDEAPSENANVIVSFQQDFKANDVLVLESDNLKTLQGSYTFEYRLESDLNPGDAVKVQDPVQSILFMTGEAGNPIGGSIRMYRNVLNAQVIPDRLVSFSGINGSISCVEITDDGDNAFIGTRSGSVFRISGLNDVYTQDDADNATIQSLVNVGGPVTGLALDHNDNNRLIVTAGNFGTANKVRYSDDALAASPTFVNVHGDLPLFPVYEAEFNVNDPNMVLIGTEFGLWATADITAGVATTWSDENDPMSYIPINDIRQQYLPFAQANNSGVMYIGSYGRGIWESSDDVFVSVPEFGDAPLSDKFVSDFKVFPNPVQGEGVMEFEAALNGKANITIFDINGRQISTRSQRIATGNNRISFQTTGMRSGSYFAIIDVEGQTSTAKFMVMK